MIIFDVYLLLDTRAELESIFFVTNKQKRKIKKIKVNYN